MNALQSPNLTNIQISKGKTIWNQSQLKRKENQTDFLSLDDVTGFLIETRVCHSQCFLIEMSELRDISIEIGKIVFEKRLNYQLFSKNESSENPEAVFLLGL